MEKIQAEMLIAEYEAALNAAKVDQVPAFYTTDAIFMPDSTQKLTKADLLKKSQSFLNKNLFHISYSIKDVVVKGEYAFVQATAQTKTVYTHTEVIKTSQDFFVLRNEQQKWKIFRYMFNNVKEH